MAQSNTTEYNNWEDFKSDFKDRISLPFKFPQFMFYFIFVIVITGLLGVVLTFYVEHNATINGKESHVFSHIHIALSIASYFVALLTASSVDLVLSSKEGETSFVMVGISSIILGLCLMIGVLLFETCPFMEYFCAIVGLLFSWLIWWIANSENSNLTKRINPENAVPTIETLSGDITKYKL